MKMNDPIQTNTNKIHPSPFQYQETLKETNQGSINSFNKESVGNTQQEKELMLMIVKIIQALIEMLTPETKAANTTPSGGSPASISDSKPVKTVNTSSSPSGTSKTGTNSKIPKATENIQNFQLGSKNISVGSNGTASATEVEETAQSIKHAYQSSPTFQNMIDKSSDPSFAVTVGKRNDNTSWGNTGGKIFMNLNNIQASNNDTFQALLSHEFAHASIDLKHGAEIQRIEKAVAKET
jgi:hypothetical protein